MITVVQSMQRWLERTNIWIYNQIHYLPHDIENHILCEYTLNVDQFPVDNLHSLKNIAPSRYLWEKRLKRLRLSESLSSSVKLLNKIKPNIIHSHFGDIGWYDMGTAKKTHARHIVTFYGTDASRMPAINPRKWNKQYNELFSHASQILCEGPYIAETLKRLGCPEEKVIVNHLGVVVSEIDFKQREWSHGTPLRVLISATFREKKGIPFAIEALGRICKDVPLEITIVGDAKPEDRSIREKEKILSLIEKYNLGPKVKMRGYIPYAELMQEAYNHHIFLSPSVTAEDGDNEGGAPVSLIDLSATGLIAVSSNHCDIPEIVIHGETGLLSEERDVEGIARNIMWLVENPGKWAKIAENARARIEKEFSATTQAEKLAAIYRNIAEV